jgi:hypothetical protein
MELYVDELINALRNQIGELHLQVTILSLQLAKAKDAESKDKDVKADPILKD